MFSQEVIFVLLSIIASLIGFGVYCRSILRKDAQPHVISWLNWSAVMSVGTYAQYQLGGGLSVWGLGVVAATCMVITVWAFFIGKTDITRSDWIAFGGAAVAFLLEKTTPNPIAGLILILCFDMLSYWPTVRKSWTNPWGEPAGAFFLSGLRYFFLLFTIPHPTASTLFYPFWLMAVDWGFTTYILSRRRILDAEVPASQPSVRLY